MIEKNHAEIAIARERATAETSNERFDRVAFAERAIAILQPVRTTIAICEGARRLHVASGRRWGGAPGERWAMLAIPPRASRRAIALAVAEIAGARADEPWVFDVLLGDGPLSSPFSSLPYRSPA
jgi:hypothetical protein